MLAVPSALQSKLDEHLRIRSIPANLHGPYQKWLRYYLDFCPKYHFPPQHEEPAPFIWKLQEKRQSKDQQEQAAAAITMYYDILKEMGTSFDLISGAVWTFMQVISLL